MKLSKVYFRMKPAVLFLAVVILLTNCGGKAADTAHGKQYANHMISFTYPGNWEVSDEQILNYPYYVEVKTNINSFSVIYIVESMDDPGLQDFAGRYIDFYSTEMDKNRLWEAGKSAVGEITRTPDYESITERFILKKIQASSPRTRFYRRKAGTDFVCYVVSQAPDVELSLVAAGFDQIAKTLSILNKTTHGVE
jgi:hypothetical protein